MSGRWLWHFSGFNERRFHPLASLHPALWLSRLRCVHNKSFEANSCLQRGKTKAGSDQRTCMTLSMHCLQGYSRLTTDCQEASSAVISGSR